ncbi:MAG: hypothetical protein KGN76_13780 [Acidobacteriota bacterium]|nr:hypothetical protein [Acidobacteriota bacterium]
MKQLAIATVVLCLATAATAQAQTPAAGQTPSTASRIFAEVDGGVTFGGTTSSVVQGQVGVRVWPAVDVFVEGGRFRDVAPSAVTTRAGVVTTYLNTLGKGTAAAHVTMPATFGAVGARYYFSETQERLHPYAMVAIGVASVKNDAKFSLNGTDITGTIGNYGVQLGSDLSGTQTRALLSFGGGVTMDWNPIFVDAAVRYSRLFTQPTGTNVGSVYAGVGYKF